MKYTRLFANSSGESHAEEINVGFSDKKYAPPAPAFGLSEITDAARMHFVSFPSGWDSDFHPTPRRQYFAMLSGTFFGTTSDGSTITLEAGDVLLMEDTTGKGHRAKVLGDSDVHAIMIHLE